MNLLIYNSLSGNHIGDLGVKYICEILKINSTIQTIKYLKLDYHNLNIKSNTSIFITLFFNLLLNYYYFSLGWNHFEEEGEKFLVEAILINPSLKDIE